MTKLYGATLWTTTFLDHAFLGRPLARTVVREVLYFARDVSLFIFNATEKVE